MPPSFLISLSNIKIGYCHKQRILTFTYLQTFLYNYFHKFLFIPQNKAWKLVSPSFTCKTYFIHADIQSLRGFRHRGIFFYYFTCSFINFYYGFLTFIFYRFYIAVVSIIIFPQKTIRLRPTDNTNFLELFSFLQTWYKKKNSMKKAR